jgi:hypothetical protein
MQKKGLEIEAAGAKASAPSTATKVKSRHKSRKGKTLSGTLDLPQKQISGGYIAPLTAATDGNHRDHRDRPVPKQDETVPMPAENPQKKKPAITRRDFYDPDISVASNRRRAPGYSFGPPPSSAPPVGMFRKNPVAEKKKAMLDKEDEVQLPGDAVFEDDLDNGDACDTSSFSMSQALQETNPYAPSGVERGLSQTEKTAPGFKFGTSGRFGEQQQRVPKAEVEGEGDDDTVQPGFEPNAKVARAKAKVAKAKLYEAVAVPDVSVLSNKRKVQSFKWPDPPKKDLPPKRVSTADGVRLDPQSQSQPHPAAQQPLIPILLLLRCQILLTTNTPLLITNTTSELTLPDTCPHPSAIYLSSGFFSRCS